MCCRLVCSSAVILCVAEFALLLEVRFWVYGKAVSEDGLVLAGQKALDSTRLFSACTKAR